MLNKLVYILCFLGIPSLTYGQKTLHKEVNGKLLASMSSLTMETIYLYNKQSKKGVLSDSSGNFKLSVRLGDTIIASAMQIETKELIIEQMHLNDAYVTLSLQPNIEFLQEVRLTNRKLTGNLAFDLKTLPLRPVVTSTDLGFSSLQPYKTKGERVLDSYTPYSLKSFNQLDLEWLYAAISGNLKLIKRRVTLEKRGEKQQNIIKRVPNTFYSQYLNLQPEDIPHFIGFCEFENDLDILLEMPITEYMELLEKTAVIYKNMYPERF